MRDEEYRKACDLFLNRVHIALKDFAMALGDPDAMQDPGTQRELAGIVALLAESIRVRERT